LLFGQLVQAGSSGRSQRGGGGIPTFAEYLHLGEICFLKVDVWRIYILNGSPARDVLFRIFLLLITFYRKNLKDVERTVWIVVRTSLILICLIEIKIL
jgi:hypothetical protein